jgi:predicted enzyme involved in methoxymalonyl-ACP biosynthesis
MSCRIFARGAETFILRRLVAEARMAGVATIIGEYLPTARNGVVADLYDRLGFTVAEPGRRWVLAVPENDAALPSAHIAAAPG